MRIEAGYDEYYSIYYLKLINVNESQQFEKFEIGELKNDQTISKTKTKNYMFKSKEGFEFLIYSKNTIQTMGKLDKNFIRNKYDIESNKQHIKHLSKERYK